MAMMALNIPGLRGNLQGAGRTECPVLIDNSRLRKLWVHPSRTLTRCAATGSTESAPVLNGSKLSNLAFRDERETLKCKLLLETGSVNRGALAGPQQRLKIADLIFQLENANPEPAPCYGQPAPIEGTWELLYSTTEQFRSSPFFWAFQNGLVQDAGLADAIFRFTDSIPGATIGRATQFISFTTSMLVSDVVLEVFPGIKGSVVTTSRVMATSANELLVTVKTTKVRNTNVTPFLEQISVPVKTIFERLRGAGTTDVRVRVTYVDSDLRISRTVPDDATFVYKRVLS